MGRRGRLDGCSHDLSPPPTKTLKECVRGAIIIGGSTTLLRSAVCCVLQLISVLSAVSLSLMMDGSKRNVKYYVIQFFIKNACDGYGLSWYHYYFARVLKRTVETNASAMVSFY